MNLSELAGCVAETAKMLCITPEEAWEKNTDEESRSGFTLEEVLAEIKASKSRS